MTSRFSQLFFAKFLQISVCAPMLACAIGIPVHAQDSREAASAAAPITQLMQRHVMLRSSVPPDPNRVRTQVKPRTQQTNLTSVNTGPGIVYTCDSSVAASTCAYLNGTVANFYNSTFTNANGSVYIQYGTTSLGESLTIYNFVTYSQYVSALTAVPNQQTFQTDAISALNTYDATPYSGGNVKITSALGRALGFSGMKGVNAQETAICTAGTTGCYDVVITVSNTAPLYYDDQGGAEPSDAYDFYAVVMHETDEMLGTSSCIDTNNGALTDACANLGGAGVPSAVDLFRYTAPGTLALDSAPSQAVGLNGQYFSFDGGAHYGIGGNANVAKIYNTLANGEDFADYSHTELDSCAYNEAIQDAEGCPGEDGDLTILNDGESEITILATIGYALPGASSPGVLSNPAPGSTLTSSSVTFSWSAGSGATEYELWIGTKGVGSSNILYPGVTTGTSETVSSLPTNGETLYVRLYSKVAGVWKYFDYTYKAESTGGLAVLTSPATGSTLASSSVAFSWTAGTGATEYELWIGSTGVGSSNIHYPGITTATSETVTALPTNGETLYVRLYSKIAGVWKYNDYTYTAEPLGVLTTPAPGSTLTSTSVNFAWKAGVGATEYELWVGTTGVGSSNLNYPGVTTGTSETVSDLPASGGGTVYVRLYSKINGSWQYNDYTYKAE